MKYKEAIEKLDELINNIPKSRRGKEIVTTEKFTNKIEEKHKWIKLKKIIMLEVSDKTIRRNKEIPKKYSELINRELDRKGLEINRRRKVQA